jgi:archaemetzincin
MKIFTAVFSLAVFLCCTNSEKQANNITDQKSAKSPDTIPQLVICVQPFDDIHEKYTKHILASLKKLYPSVKMKESIPLPAHAFYKPRQRYRADTLINFLRKISGPDEILIGLTSKDISTTKGDIQDYGIMGLGYQPGKACVISTFRLNKKQDMFEQVYRLAVHELGHTQGLPHCPDKSCFMRDAEGKNHFSEEKGFCANCKKFLEGKGWKFQSS